MQNTIYTNIQDKSQQKAKTVTIICNSFVYIYHVILLKVTVLLQPTVNNPRGPTYAINKLEDNPLGYEKNKTKHKQFKAIIRTMLIYHKSKTFLHVF